MMCGRCENVCPVGIDIRSIRMISRNELNGKSPDPSFYQSAHIKPRKADVIFFAGCMTHQTPAVKKAMQRIFTAAGIDYWFMDEEGGICCGRPMMLAGHHEQAELMMAQNKQLIAGSGAKVLVTSCPICYKIFAKEYQLNIRVLHHTQYLYELAEAGKLPLGKLSGDAVYHDPCELSRDIRIYDEPRALLKKMINLVPAPFEHDNTLCCGNSLANFSSGNEMKKIVARDAYNKLNSKQADNFVTSCPLCKKSFEKVSDVPVKDIAELVNMALKAEMPEAISIKGRSIPVESSATIREKFNY